MAEIKIKADSGGGTVSFKGPASTTGDNPVQLTLPVDDGAANEYLKTDGSGALSWSAVSAGAGGATALSLNDGVKVNFGADNDLRIEGGSGNSTIQHQDTAAGDLFIDAQNSSIYLRSGDGSTGEQDAIVCQNNGKIMLKHAGTLVAETSANGLAFPSGKGIDFSAVSHSGGMTSELLDSYEEGTWTPSDGGGDFAFNTAEGTYVKIGRLVILTMFLYEAGSVTSSSSAYIVGLPFTAANTDAAGGLAIGNNNSSDDFAWSIVNKNTSHAQFHKSTGANMTKAQMWDGASTPKYLYGSYVYQTA